MYYIIGEMLQEEEAKVEAKPEEKAEEKKEEKKEEKQEEKEEEPKPPSPLILYVDLHCAGCAKKVERSIMKIRGKKFPKLNYHYFHHPNLEIPEFYSEYIVNRFSIVSLYS